MRDRSGKREIDINEGRRRPDRERKRSVPMEGSLDVDQNAWRRVAWMMAGVVMTVVDRRHATVEHGGEVEWVRSRCEQVGVGVQSWWCSVIWAKGAARSRLALAWLGGRNLASDCV